MMVNSGTYLRKRTCKTDTMRIRQTVLLTFFFNKTIECKWRLCCLSQKSILFRETGGFTIVHRVTLVPSAELHFATDGVPTFQDFLMWILDNKPTQRHTFTFFGKIWTSVKVFSFESSMLTHKRGTCAWVDRTSPPLHVRCDAGL